MAPSQIPKSVLVCVALYGCKPAEPPKMIQRAEPVSAPVMASLECPLVYLTEPPIDICPGQVTCSLPDLDQDGVVGINDFLDVLALWGDANCMVYKRGDINWDGKVDAADMLIILAAWDNYDSDTWNRCDCS